MCQPAGGAAKMLCCVDPVPSISQIAACPLSFCQTMSDFPSPLKSPVVIACHDGGGFATISEKASAVPSISQMEVQPFIGSAAFAALLYCHRMSGLPSPLKSPVAIVCQDGG